MPKLLSILFALLIIASQGLSQTADDVARPFTGIPGPGSRAEGLGQAYTAISNDFAGIHYNPSGLAHIARSELIFGGTYFSLNNSITAPINEPVTSSISQNYFKTTSLGYLYPVANTKLTLGLGYYVASMLEQAFNIQGDDYTITIQEESILGSYSISGGYQLRKELSVGLSLHLYQGQKTYTDVYRETGTNYVDPWELESDYSGLGATIGFLWAPTNFLRTGLSVKTPTRLNVDETETSGWTGSYTVTSPPEIHVGQALNIGNLLLTGSLYWKEWALSSMSTSITDTLTGKPIDLKINQNIRDVFSSGLDAVGYALGGEFLLPFVNVKLRGGVHYIPHYRTDRLPRDKWVTSFGTSAVIAQQFKIDVSVSQTDWIEEFTTGESASINNTWITGYLSYRF